LIARFKEEPRRAIFANLSVDAPISKVEIAKDDRRSKNSTYAELEEEGQPT